MRVVGRQDELQRIERWIESGGRLLTVTGPVGVGKSALAKHALALHPPAIACDLTAVASAPELVTKLSAALGASRARLRSALRELGGLVLLDGLGCAEEARSVVEEWALMGVRMIVTATSPVGVTSEEILELAPLSPSDAIALYTARAGRMVDVRIAAKVVEELGYLPLALELVAPRAALARDEEVLTRVRAERGRAETTGLHDAVRAALERLAPLERSVLLQCAVFRGPFDARAAEVVSREPEAAHALSALTTKSLVRRVDAQRVALFAPVRDVGQQLLAETHALTPALERHARYHASARPSTELADWTAAWSALCTLDRRASVELALGIDEARAGQLPSVEHLALLATSLELAEALGELGLAARVREARARCARLRGDIRVATCELRAALAHARAGDDVRIEGDVLRMLGVVARQRAQPLRARVLLARAHARYERADFVPGMARTLSDQGVVRHDLGQLAEARALYERSLACARLAGDRRFEGIATCLLGIVADELGTGALAREHYRSARGLHREVADLRFEGFGRAFEALSWWEEGDRSAARRVLVDSPAFADPIDELDSGALLACVAIAFDAADRRLPEARERLERARRALAHDEDVSRSRMLVCAALSIDVAEVERAQLEDDERARERVAWVRDALEQSGPPRWVEERLLRRFVERRLEAALARVDVALVSDDGEWFESRRRRVSLARRRALAFMLAKLAGERLRAPGRTVSLDALFEAGWPGERAQRNAAKRRVYVGIDTLRALGLRSVIIQRECGYLLDPARAQVARAAPHLNEL